MTENSIITLKSDHGKFASAEEGGGLQGQIIDGRPAGLMTATRDSAGAWESFFLVPSIDGDGTFGLNSCHGFYACCENAEEDSKYNRPGIIVFRSLSLGAWEKFKLHFREDDNAKVSFESVCRPGYFIKVYPEGRVVLEQPYFDGQPSTEPGGYETFISDPPISTRQPPLITGQLRVSDSGWADDIGPIHPIGLHVGDLFSKLCHGYTNHVESIIVSARNAGYPFIHFWMNLGTLGDYWAGRECGPGYTPDFWGKLSQLGDLFDKHGMKGGYNLGDYKLWSGTHKDFFRKLGQHLRSRQHQTAAYVFGGNEAWQTGASSKEEISDALDEFKGEVATIPVTTTAPPSEDASEIAKWCAGDFYAIHGYRDGEDHDRIRHIFSVPWEGHPPNPYGLQDEPTGPGDEVSVKARHCYKGRDVDSNHLCALAVQSLMCNQGFNYFCSDGVKSDGDITSWAGFNEVGRVSQIVPIDIMAWPGPIHFGDSQPDRVFSPCSEDTLRFDHRISHSGELFGMFYGDEGTTRARCERACSFSRVDWDGTVHPEEHFNPGDEISFNFYRSSGGQPNGYTAQAIIGYLR